MFDYFYGQSGEMFSYFRVPKILFRDIKFKDLSTDAKTLYGILLDRMGLSVKNGWLDEQGRVYIIFPVQEVMDALGCADNKATKLFRELEKFGLIERKRRGLGKPNLIYVKNFADPRFRNREKNGSGAADSAQQETAKSRGNKTEWNKTEGSEPDPFSSDAEDESDERTRLEAYFMQSLEVDLLLRACPDEEDTIHQIVNLLWIPALRNAECCGWQGLVRELRLMQCYLMPDETALRELSEQVIEKLKRLTDAEFAGLEFPMN